MNARGSADASCWVISDGAAGNERQASALARALQLVPRVVRVRLREPWNTFAPHFTFAAAAAIRDATAAHLAPPWPDIAIGCGRRAALVTRMLRRWSGGRCFCVQVLDPRIDSAAFDLVIAPRHDTVVGCNVLHTIGALNLVDAEWLAKARIEFAHLAVLQAPRSAVLIGASNSAQQLDDTYFDALLDHLAADHRANGGSFLVSVSRRTPAATAMRLRRTFARLPGIFWNSDVPSANPYAGFLGWADRLVVTPDSVNMLSEACATGKPVFTFAPRPVTGKLAAFHAALMASGHLHPLDDETPWSPSLPLAETSAIADLVRARWQARCRT